MSANDKKLRRCAIIVCELFVLVTFVMLLLDRQYNNRLLLAAITAFMVLMPSLAEKLFSFKFHAAAYLFSMLYALGPMLGHCWNFYYTISWWDKLLHSSGGVMFAILGLLIFERFIGTDGKKSIIMAASFAVCFSVALSVLWEFYEFGSDMFLGTDMQNDTVITQINSYFLSDLPGIAGSISAIDEVIVNGEALPVAGYIDIGLIDTMLDMLVETVGALVTAAVYLMCKGRIYVSSPLEDSHADTPTIAEKASAALAG